LEVWDEMPFTFLAASSAGSVPEKVTGAGRFCLFLDGFVGVASNTKAQKRVRAGSFGLKINGSLVWIKA